MQKRMAAQKKTKEVPAPDAEGMHVIVITADLVEMYALGLVFNGGVLLSTGWEAGNKYELLTRLRFRFLERGVETKYSQTVPNYLEAIDSMNLRMSFCWLGGRVAKRGSQSRAGSLCFTLVSNLHAA